MENSRDNKLLCLIKDTENWRTDIMSGKRKGGRGLGKNESAQFHDDSDDSDVIIIEDDEPVPVPAASNDGKGIINDAYAPASGSPTALAPVPAAGNDGKAKDTNVTWESMDHTVRTIIWAMSADERETVSFRIVKARMLEIGLTNDQVTCHKEAIKDLSSELIEMGRACKTNKDKKVNDKKVKDKKVKDKKVKDKKTTTKPDHKTAGDETAGGGSNDKKCKTPAGGGSKDKKRQTPAGGGSKGKKRHQTPAGGGSKDKTPAGDTESDSSGGNGKKPETLADTESDSENSKGPCVQCGCVDYPRCNDCENCTFDGTHMSWGGWAGRRDEGRTC